jgi:hypothetical protein
MHLQHAPTRWVEVLGNMRHLRCLETYDIRMHFAITAWLRFTQPEAVLVECLRGLVFEIAKTGVVQTCRICLVSRYGCFLAISPSCGQLWNGSWDFSCSTVVASDLLSPARKMAHKNVARVLLHRRLPPPGGLLLLLAASSAPPPQRGHNRRAPRPSSVDSGDGVVG